VLSNKGDAVMVTAVLLLSLAVSVGGRLLISYGEAQGKEMDMAHVDDVQDSMMGMRGSMYTLLDAGDTRTHIVNRVTLGTFGNPYLAVARSSGTLSVEPTPSQFSMALMVGPSGLETILDSISGAIVYTGDLYYFEDQDYHFEGGAVIIDEGGSMAMASPPSFELRQTPTGFGLIVSLYGMGGNEVSISGIESVIVKVRMETYTTHSIDLAGQSVRIRINSFAEKVWKDHFSEIFATAGLVPGVDYTFTDPVDWNDPYQYLDVEFKGMDFIHSRMGVMGVML
jgi:hypothetical protein